MPILFGKQEKKQNILKNMEPVLKEVQTKYKISNIDLPDIKWYINCIKNEDFTKFPRINGDRLEKGKKFKQLEHGIIE